jgi:hypothetical protein
MKKFLYLFLACFWFLILYFPPGYSWGEDKKDQPKDRKAPQKSLSGTVRGKAQKETEEVKKDTKASGREVKESGKELLDKTGSEFKKTGKALKETGRKLKENVGETWKDLKKQLKK